MGNKFDEPLDPRNEKEIKSPWNFEAPKYDDRSGNAINAGTDYGSGHKNPVGHLGPPKMRVASLPFDLVSNLRKELSRKKGSKLVEKD